QGRQFVQALPQLCRHGRLAAGPQHGRVSPGNVDNADATAGEPPPPQRAAVSSGDPAISSTEQCNSPGVGLRAVVADGALHSAPDRVLGYLLNSRSHSRLTCGGTQLPRPACELAQYIWSALGGRQPEDRIDLKSHAVSQASPAAVPARVGFQDG